MRSLHDILRGWSVHPPQGLEEEGLVHAHVFWKVLREASRWLFIVHTGCTSK